MVENQQVLINDTTMTEIGNAIREKLFEEDKYYPREMPDKIRQIGGEIIKKKDFIMIRDDEDWYFNQYQNGGYYSGLADNIDATITDTQWHEVANGYAKGGSFSSGQTYLVYWRAFTDSEILNLRGIGFRYGFFGAQAGTPSPQKPITASVGFNFIKNKFEINDTTIGMNLNANSTWGYYKYGSDKQTVESRTNKTPDYISIAINGINSSANDPYIQNNYLAYNSNNGHIRITSVMSTSDYIILIMDKGTIKSSFSSINDFLYNLLCCGTRAIFTKTQFDNLNYDELDPFAKDITTTLYCHKDIQNFQFAGKYDDNNLLNKRISKIICEKTIQNIGDYPFVFCEGIQSITFYSQIPPNITENTFKINRRDDTLITDKIYVPLEYLETYKNTWSQYANIIYPIVET